MPENITIQQETCHEIFSLGSIIAIASLFAEEFDRGGITFPMEKLSAEHFPKSSKAQGENLLKNGDLAGPLASRAADCIGTGSNSRLQGCP